MLGVLALLLSVTTDAFGSRVCPHHAHASIPTETLDGAGTAVPLAADSDRLVGHEDARPDTQIDAHAGHAEAHAADPHAGHGHPHDAHPAEHPGDHGCDCAFHCVGSAGPAPLESAVGAACPLVAPEDPTAACATSESEAASHPALIPFVLPFANTPPASS